MEFENVLEWPLNNLKYLEEADDDVNMNATQPAPEKIKFQTFSFTLPIVNVN